MTPRLQTTGDIWFWFGDAAARDFEEKVSNLPELCLKSQNHELCFIVVLLEYVWGSTCDSTAGWDDYGAGVGD